MKVLKANYKIEEKKWHDHLDWRSGQDESGLYWMYKINGEMAQKVLLKPPLLKKGIDRILSKVYNEREWDRNR